MGHEDCEQTCPFHGTCKGLIRECEQLRENDRLLMQQVGDTKVKVAEVEQSSRSAHHRLDSMEEQTKAVIRLAVSVETMSDKVEKVLTLFEDHDGRLASLEGGPGKTAVKAWTWLLVAFVSGTVGMVFAIVTKKFGG